MTQQEFNILSSSIRGKLLAMAGRYKSRTGLDDDAEDIVQEALLTLWKLSSEGYPVRDAEALAVKITKNLAVAVALFFVIRPNVRGSNEAVFTPVEIAQSLNTMINLNLQDIESIVAEPKGTEVILTAKMKDGSSSTFVMSREQETGSTIILAQDNSRRKQ